ncbi:hypothetical protein ATM97_22425 [Nocardia sp. MH4]|nr:hypothetical protein [Nocardia sp. MH4]
MRRRPVHGADHHVDRWAPPPGSGQSSRQIGDRVVDSLAADRPVLPHLRPRSASASAAGPGGEVGGQRERFDDRVEAGPRKNDTEYRSTPAGGLTTRCRVAVR